MSTPIKTPLTYEDALDLADAAIYHDPENRMDERIARALMRVDVASREQAQPPQHDAATCQTCKAIKAGREAGLETAEEIAAFYDARNKGEECGD